jgi:hypothetical protein
MIGMADELEIIANRFGIGLVFVEQVLKIKSASAIGC